MAILALALLWTTGIFFVAVGVAGGVSTIEPWPHDRRYSRSLSGFYTFLSLTAGCGCIALATKAM